MGVGHAPPCAGNLQQQVAAMGALQALAYCPEGDSAAAVKEVADGGCVTVILKLLRAGPLPARCLAAGTLANLVLGNPKVRVRASSFQGLKKSLVVITDLCHQPCVLVRFSAGLQDGFACTRW